MSSVERELIRGGPIDPALTRLPSGMLEQVGLMVVEHQQTDAAARFADHVPGQVLVNEAGGIDPEGQDTSKHLVVRAVIAHNSRGIEQPDDYVAAGLLHPLLGEHETIGRDFYKHMLGMRMLLSSIVLIPDKLNREEQGPLMVREAVARTQEFVDLHAEELYRVAEESDEKRAA